MLKSNKVFLRFLEKNLPQKKSDLVLQGEDYKTPSFTLHIHKRLRIYLMMIEKYCSNPRRVLDVGSYPGSIARTIKLIYPDCSMTATGIGFNNEFYEMMRGEQIEVIEWDTDPALPPSIPAGKYPFTLPERFKESFCLVTAGGVIHHISNSLHMFRQINKILRLKGVFMFDEVCGSYVMNGMRLLAGRPIEPIEYSAMYQDTRNEWGGHVRFFTAIDFLKMLSDTGFKIEKIIYYGSIIPEGRKSFVLKMCHALKSFSYIIPHLRPAIFVVARKVGEPRI